MTTTTALAEKYDVMEEVGQGGMAVVYRGIDRHLNREVAIKVLHRHLANETESKERFQREAHAVAKLHHDNILEIYDYSGMNSDDNYIVTEFIHGQTLKQYLSRHPISHPEIAAMITVEVCKALAHAHHTGVIHRDIKPENIMIRDDGRIKLMDFGIAQMVDVQRLTVTGQLLGSPAYMAPELIQGKELDFRSDVYSVGILLYQLATSELPFKGKNPHEVLKRIAEGRYIDPEIANPIVGRRLGRIIRKALAHDPTNRYAEIEQFQHDLEEFLAEVELSDIEAELSSYFKNPVEYSQMIQKRIVTSLTDRGKDALANRRTAHALQCFDRVLCIDPQNEEICRLLNRIARRKATGKIAIMLGLIAGLGASAYAIVTHWPTTEISIPPRPSNRPVSTTVRSNPSVATNPTLESIPAIDATATKTVLVSDANEVSPSTTHPNPPSSIPSTQKGSRRSSRAVIEHRTLEVIPTPKNVSMFVNGKLLGVYGPNLRFIELPNESVSLLFRNEECCYDKKLIFHAGDERKTLYVQLAWKPARVRVEVVPEQPADVVVGSVVGRANQIIQVPIPDYSRTGMTDVEIKVSAKGVATISKKITVQANRLATLSIPLSP